MSILLALQIIFPIIVLVILGAMLSKWSFLRPETHQDLYKLVFWIGLPCLLVEKCAQVDVLHEESFRLCLIVITASCLTLGLAWLSIPILKIDRESLATYLQSCFRGNMAFVGLPMIAFYSQATTSSLESQAVLVLIPTAIFYNVVAVFLFNLLHKGRGPFNLVRLFVEPLKNPLIISSLLGFTLYTLSIDIPRPVTVTLSTMGQMSLPLALICIGMSLSKTRLGSLRDPSMAAIVMKLVICPMLGLLMCHFLNIQGSKRLIIIVLLSCPTASISHVLVQAYRGDESLSAKTIFLSVCLAPIPLTLALFC